MVGRLGNRVVVSMNVDWLTPIRRWEAWVQGEKGAFVADLLSGEVRSHAKGQDYRFQAEA